MQKISGHQKQFKIFRNRCTINKQISLLKKWKNAFTVLFLQ